MEEILEAANHGSGELPAPPAPDTTRVAPPSNVVDPNNINAAAWHRDQAQAQYGRDPAALAEERSRSGAAGRNPNDTRP